MTFPAETNAFAIACGANGAFVDVTESVLFNEGGITRQWGAPSDFDSVRPGQFSVTLSNADGRFTPGNSAVFETPLVEGMRVCWQLNGRLLEGTIRSFAPSFADVANAETARLRLTCDDLLGKMSRNLFGPLADQLLDAAGLFGLWKFDDDPTSRSAVDSGPFALPALVPTATVSGVAFGGTPLPWLQETQGNMGAVTFFPSLFANPITTAFDYLPNSGGAYGFWVTVNNSPATAGVFFAINISRPAGSPQRIRIELADDGNLTFGTAVTSPTGFKLERGKPYYVSVDVRVVGANVVQDLYVDGAFVATASYAHGGAVSKASLSPAFISITAGAVSDVTDYQFSRLSHTRTRVREELARDANTLAGVINYIEAAAEGVTFGSLPNLWDAPVQLDSVAGSSALDLLNEAITTEQGYVYPTTTGTLTNPTTVLNIRRRDRPADVDYAFTTTTDILGQPDMTRDLSNTVSAVNVQGPTQTVTVVENSLVPVVGQVARSERTLLVRSFDLRAWGEDRIDRGTNVALDVREFVVDAQGTNTDRWNDLLNMIPGDRVRVAGLPSAQLGFSTFDGWLVGGKETHTAERNLFTMRLARTLPPVAKYNSAKYMASGELSLNGAINTSATSISVKSTGARLSTIGVPYVIQIDDEHMTVTSVSGSSSPQTVTVTRGVNGTTPATHANNAILVGPVPESIYAF